MMRRAALAALMLWAAPAQADTAATAAATAPATAARAAEMLEQAGFDLMQADGARDRVEALTRTVRAYEEGLLALREGMRQAALREQTILLAFEAERDRLGRLLGVLQTIDAAPAPLLLMHPEGALGTARSGMILSEVTPAVAAEARALRDQLQELATLRALQDDAVAQLSAALARAQDARTQLSQAIADRRSLPENFIRDETAMTELLASVDSLDGLAAVLSQDAAGPAPDLPDFAAARGTLDPPVLGALLRRFGEADAAGVARPGLVLAARPRALVTAPWPATVRYAGPLRDYGNVIILEPQGGYLLVLAGLGTVYAAAGDIVTAGAALGLMPGGNDAGDAGAEELIAAAPQSGGGDLAETLYIELREAGAPVDPADWFTAIGRD